MTISFEQFCNVCNTVRKFLFVRDEGRDEVYQCPECHCLHRVAVR